MLESLKNQVLAKFASIVSAANGVPARIFDATTDDVRSELRKGNDVARSVKSMQFASPRLAMGGGAQKRLEENYLFDTRRFASGAQTAGEYIFFGNAVGLPGQNNGFVSPMIMSEVETNMDVASQVPQGKDFVMTQVGISFNSQAIAADVALLLEAGALRFSKQGGQFTLKHGVGRLWPGGTGVLTNTAAATPASNGVPDIRAVRRLSVPRVLRAKDTFNYSYYIPRAVSNLDNSTAITLTGNVLMTVWLWGAQQDNIPV